MSTKLLAHQHPLLARLDLWIRDGWMRPLEKALVMLLLEQHEDANDTVLLLAALTSQQLGQGDICLDLEQAVAKPQQLFPHITARQDGDSPLRWLAQQSFADLSAALRQSPLVDSDGHASERPLVLDSNLLYLRRHYNAEQQVAEQVQARLLQPVVVPEDLGARLATLFPPQSDGATDWQKVACALAARSNLTLITGGPGTGKTTTVVRLLGLLQAVAMETRGQPLRIRLAAPTGKAAARLKTSISNAIEKLPLAESVRASIPAEVSTLHKLLGSRPDSRRFRHHRHNPLHADLVVVDEASMMDLEMAASLLDALRPDTRLILIGDKDQLASVEAGAVLGNLCQGADQGGYHTSTLEWLQQHTGEDISALAGNGSLLAQHTAMLRTSHRFRADSGIGSLARAVNSGDKEAIERVWQASFSDLERLLLKDDNDAALLARCVDGYRHYLSLVPAANASEEQAGAILQAYEHFQVLCAVRDGAHGVSGLNQRIARSLHQAGLIARSEGWYPGRPVIMTRNDYSLGLMNGDIGITLNTGTVEAPRLRVAFRLSDGRLRLILPSRLDGAESVYAMTVHKSQGSEFHHALLVLPDQGPGVSRELLYTAITRARQHFTLCGSAAALDLPARPTERASGLARRVHG